MGTRDDDNIIREGMLVRFAPEWCSKEERHLVLVVLEAHPDVKRCKVQILNTKMYMKPIEVVTFEMIVPIGLTVEDIRSAGQEKQRQLV